jgi:hypothetical protein
MLSNLALVSIMILSLLLLVNCVNSHKDNILTTLNTKSSNIAKTTLGNNLTEKAIMKKQDVNVEVFTRKKEEPKTKKVVVSKTLKEVTKKKREYSNLNSLEQAILEEVKKMKE